MSLASHIGWKRPSLWSSAGKSRILTKRLRAPRFAAPAFKELCKAALVLAILLSIMIALVALDIWIWVPRASIVLHTVH
jgi:hypothetical protein